MGQNHIKVTLTPRASWSKEERENAEYHTRQWGFIILGDDGKPMANRAIARELANAFSGESEVGENI